MPIAFHVCIVLPRRLRLLHREPLMAIWCRQYGGLEQVSIGGRYCRGFLSRRARSAVCTGLHTRRCLTLGKSRIMPL